MLDHAPACAGVAGGCRRVPYPTGAWKRTTCLILREVALTRRASAHVVPRVPEGLPRFLKLVAEPNRLRLLALLAHGEHCVCDLEAALGLPQNLVSHHLSALKREGLVRDRRAGKWVYYRIEPQTLGEHLGGLTVLLDTRDAGQPARPCADDEP